MAAQSTKAIEATELVDGTFAFEAGMNSGISPLLLAKSQLSFASNVTVRGTFGGPRPPYRKLALDFTLSPQIPGTPTTPQVGFEKALFQGACYYKPDTGPESLMVAIAGRLFQVTPAATSATVIERTIPNDLNPPAKVQAWLWQAEKWVIWNDGQSIPVFFDNLTTRRSNYGSPQSFNTVTATTVFIIPATGATVTITVASDANMVVGDVITVQGAGKFQIQTLSGGGVLVCVNQTGTPVGTTVPLNKAVTWSHTGTELPPGRMGVYGMGRVWESLVDGKQFLASDLVGGSSGTVVNNFRDAVLNITENLYLLGGGNFTVPGSAGDIRAMIFAATLDASLGQGPLQVFTPSTVFSCNAPVDRLTWQSLTNPILTESLIANGALGQNSTVAANGDTLFRAVDGIRSLVLGRRDFNSWGNVPISLEMDRVLVKDDATLLAYGSAVVFNNRLLITASPVGSEQGVYHQALIALNFDPISSLRGKAASVYDGLWTGINVLQVLKGQFAGVERCFAFTLDTIDGKIEVYELLPTGSLELRTFPFEDNDSVPIIWSLEGPVLLREQKHKTTFDLIRLIDGEIQISDLRGRAQFQVFYRPDEYPCWIPWVQFEVCARQPDAADATTVNFQPGFSPRSGFGQPSGMVFDSYTNRPFREAYYFQLKLIVEGFCLVRAIKVKAVIIPQPEFAKPPGKIC
jgi:hypothetical protein